MGILQTVFYVLDYLIWLYCLFIVIDAIMSWLPFLANSVVGRFLNQVVNPYLNLFRRGPIARLAFSTGIDISAIIGLLLLYFIQNDVLQWLERLLLIFVK